MKYIFLVICFLFLTSFSIAQNRNQNLSDAYNPTYNAKSMVTFKGKIARVDTIQANGKPFIVMTVRADADYALIDVHIAPMWFLAQQEFMILVYGRLEVTGSKIMYNNKEVILATELRKTDEVLTLRDTEGVPVWLNMKEPKGKRPIHK